MARRRYDCRTGVSIQGDADLRFRPSRGRECWRGNDRSRGRRWRPNRLRPAWPAGFRSLLLTECDGEKKCLSQQQSNGFPHEGTKHRPAYYYKKTQFEMSLRSSAYLCVLCVKGLFQRRVRRDTQRIAEKSPIPRKLD